MISKGHIKEDNLSNDKALLWLKEILLKCKDDAINLKAEEFELAISIITRYIDFDKIEKDASNWNSVKKFLTTTQLLKLLENKE